MFCMAASICTCGIFGTVFGTGIERDDIESVARILSSLLEDEFDMSLSDVTAGMVSPLYFW
jgi:hypothetical protein